MKDKAYVPKLYEKNLECKLLRVSSTNFIEKYIAPNLNLCVYCCCRKHLHATNPNFRFKEIPGSHHVHLNEPLTVMMEIRDFITEFEHVFSAPDPVESPPSHITVVTSSKL